MAIVWQEKDFIKAEGLKIFYEISGKGDPVLLLHGNYMDSRIWQYQVFSLVAAGYKVITCDLRGSGKSDKPANSFEHTSDVMLLLNVLGLDKTTIIGSSSGGAVAIDCALGYPERVKSLVLAAPYLNGMYLPFGMLWRFLRNYNILLAKGEEQAVDALIKDPYWQFLFPRHEYKEARRLLLDVLRSPGNYCSWNHNLAVPLKPLAKRRLEQIKVPVLIISGERDHPLYHRIAGKLQNGIPLAQSRLITDSSHVPFMDKPEEFNRLLLHFLKTNRVH